MLEDLKTLAGSRTYASIIHTPRRGLVPLLRESQRSNYRIVEKQDQKSQMSASMPANCSKYFWSTSSNPFSSAQSTSMIATTFPFCIIGTTISLLLLPSQAICPGYWSTSLTSCVFLPSAAVPQTPFPKEMS